jgi:predicted transcriptional regulator
MLSGKPGISQGSNESAVLAALGASGSWAILSFNKISEKTGLDRGQVRAACRSLKSAGLASYETGGSVGGGYNGAGYMITALGKEAIE